MQIQTSLVSQWYYTRESKCLPQTGYLTEWYFCTLPIQAKMIIHAAYGSQRHLSVYMELGLQPDQIYIISRKQRSTSKRLCQVYPLGQIVYTLQKGANKV